MNFFPADQADRDRAALTFDQNIVVTAGAGTGKTTLLIKRLLHLLMRGAEAVKITEIVALTFTKKSANEMKTRLKEKLTDLIHADADTEEVSDLISRYGLSKTEIDMRAKSAIQDLERSEVGTIHHFATGLLRLYPLESGVDPQFRIDEGGQATAALFEQCWATWLETELSAESAEKALWKSVFLQLSLSEIKAFAQALAFEEGSLVSIFSKTQQTEVPHPILLWLKSLEKSAQALLDVHPENRKVEQMLAAAMILFQDIQKTGDLSESAFETEKRLIATGKPSPVKGWEKDEFKAAEQVIKIAKQLLQIDPACLRELLKLLQPFVVIYQAESRKSGFVSFDALLSKVKNLLRDHPKIRKTLKRRYAAILIDEFQDTDPTQYEILLYLAEKEEAHATEWHDVQLIPGKLFVVGDPKQSIYGFRRADIEAYLAVKAMILQQGGIHCTLKTNFRSHAEILKVINGVFTKLMLPKEGLQSEYVPINAPEALPENNSEAAFRQVSLRLVQSESSDVNAEAGKQLEGEAIAEWLVNSVLGKATISDKTGKTRYVEKQDVAILMRSLTGIHHILKPLREAGIDYLVEGGRDFYQKSIVMDAVNLLRSVADPNDDIALVALLRSPLAGFTDDMIYVLKSRDQLNYRPNLNPEFRLSPVASTFYALLNRLHEEARKLPVGLAVARIFNETPIRILAAASSEGEQALANLEKLTKMAERLAEREGMGFRAVVAFFQAAIADELKEAESPLAEDGLDAVRVFSIHKAKGLEFPVVVLAACQSGTSPREREIAKIRHDWSTNLSGLRIGEIRDLASVFLAEKERLREIEEETRILYVAMTRAREHLMISVGPKARIQSASILAHLQSAVSEEASEKFVDSSSGAIPVGLGQISKSVISGAESVQIPQTEETPLPAAIDFEALSEVWKKRFALCETIQKDPVFLSPTRIKNAEVAIGLAKPFKKRQGVDPKTASLIGQFSHRFLEHWDFSSDAETFRDTLSSFLDQQSVLTDRSLQPLIFQEMEAIFEVFFASAPYAVLAQSKIIGRELPFVMPWEGKIMEGVIDLLYEKEGLLYIADYKTDRIEKTDLEAASKQYQHQCRIYPIAVKQALNREVAGMELIFLRIGAVISGTFIGIK